MNSLRFLVFGLFVVCVLVTVQAQTDGAQQQVSPKQESEHNPHFLGVLPESIPQTISPGEKASPQQIELTVPRATPIRIELSARARIGREGEPVVGKVTNAIYAFDQPVIPAGSEVRGHLARVVPVSKKRRVMAIADADFSPPHDYTVTLDTIILSDGRRVPVVTTAARGTREVVHLTSDPTRTAAKKKNAAARVTDSAKEEVNDTFHHAVTEVKSPGRIHRIKQFLLAQLPYRRQYLEPGTRFDADLESPLAFGPTSRLPGQLRWVGTEPVPNSTLRARLTDEVTSATASGGTPIEAVITEPVFNTDGQLVLPANSRIVGEVTQAKPAGKLHHNA